MKNVLITGATGGIGSAIAFAFAKNGYNIALHTNSKPHEAQENADSLSKAYGIKAFAVMADISNENDVKNMFETLEKDFGKIDVLVNNAGISLVSMLCDTTAEDWDRVMDVNLKGAFLCSKCAIDNMVHNKWGRIINVSSVWGNAGASCEVAYSASKAGLVGFTKALAKELAPSGLTVNAVSPGLIDTKMNSHLSDDDIKALCDEIPVGRMGTPEEVANAVLFLASEGASYITAQNITVDGGWQ
ncbi:MAG: SDR family oxidoreductase [Ruminococcaceae bacterium]|nr:SDR family oxidoreductase [Oscillospiraceae bacterium]